MNKKEILQNNFDKNGYVVVKNFLPNKDIKDVKTSLHNYIKKNFKKLKGRDIAKIKNNSISSIHNLKKWQYVKKLQNTNKVKNLAKTILREKIKKFGSELFAKPAKIGLPAPIHQDNHYWHLNDGKGITIWIALDHSNKKNGAVFYYSGSHKYGVFKHKKSFAKGSSQKIKNDRILKKFKKKFTNLEIGDLLIHHCLVLHGSKPNKSKNKRLGWTFQFKDKNSEYDLAKISKYEKQLKEQKLD